MSAPAARLAARIRRGALFVGSAAAVALALRFGHDAALLGGLGLVGLGALGWSHFMSRRRVTALLRSGDLGLVLSRWRPSLEQAPHAATMIPLMTATALAAYGRVERARAVLRAARRGPVWEAAV